MRLLRRYLIIGTLLLVLPFVLAACGDDDDDDGGDDTGNGSTPTATSSSGSGGEGETEEESGDSGDGSTPAATSSSGGAGETEEDSGDSGDGGEFSGTITFGDYGWDSAIVHNRVAQYILENGWGYETDSVAGETISLFQGLINRDIDVSMEIWVDQQPQFEPEVEAGSILDLGPNYPESIQGWYVPTYVIEGDEERGIEPMAPELESVEDLPEYVDLFEDPEDPDKGRFYGCIAGWECQRVNESKFEFYGLNEYYNRFQPGSGAALASSLVSAYETGEPWLGYYWAPTWIFAVVDLTMIQEPEYTDECWEKIQDAEGNPTGEAGCEYPSVQVHKAVNAEFAEEVPQEVTDFISAYETTMEQNNEFLLYMNENEIEDHQIAAIWFLKEHQDLWTEWVPVDVAEKVMAQLETEAIP